MKKTVALILALIMVLALTACGQSAAPAASAPDEAPASAPAEAPASAPAETETTEQAPAAPAEVKIPNQQLSFASAASGGAYYVIVTGICEVVSSHVPELNLTCEITDGGVANPRIVNDGEADIGMSNSDSVMFALQGVTPYDGVMNIEPIFSLHASAWQCVTLPGSGINSFEDLKGKKVAVGPAGGGAMAGLGVVFEAYGMTIDDIIPSYISFDDGVTQLKDGQVEACVVMAGVPTPALSSLAATNKFVMINIDDEHMAKISEIAPYYSRVVLPADMYNMDADGYSLGVKNIVYVSGDLDDDTVYVFTKAVIENLDEIRTYHSALSGLTPEGMADIGDNTFSPGAERYFREIGLVS